MAELKTGSTAGGDIILTQLDIGFNVVSSDNNIDFSLGYNFEITLDSYNIINATNLQIGQKGIININNNLYTSVELSDMFTPVNPMLSINTGVITLSYSIIDSNTIFVDELIGVSNWDYSINDYDPSFSYYKDFSLITGNNGQVFRFGLDGYKLYIAENSDRIVEYSLTSPYDLSTVVVLGGNSVYIGNESTTAYDIAFNPDGTTMYILSEAIIFEYSLSIPWQVNSAVYTTVNFSVAGQDNAATTFKFKPDGTQMFMLGINDNLHKYDMSTPWDISTAVYDDAIINIGYKEQSTMGMFINDAGDRMYITGLSNDKVFEFKFTTPWDFSVLDGLAQEIDISSESLNPYHIEFSPSGYEMFLYDGTSKVYVYKLDTAWELTTANYYHNNLYLALRDNTPRDIEFSHDGSKLFYLGGANTNVFAWELKVPWDVSSGTYSSEFFDVSGLFASPSGLRLSPDGNRMFVCGYSADIVAQYDLGTPWDISTAVFNNSYSVSINDTTPIGLDFNKDGTIMYIVGGANDKIFSYTLSTVWDITSSTYLGVYTPTETGSALNGVTFNPSGTKMYLTDNTNTTSYQYSLSTPWDITTALYDVINKHWGAVDDSPSKLTFSNNGRFAYILGINTDTIYQFDIVK